MFKCNLEKQRDMARTFVSLNIRRYATRWTQYVPRIFNFSLELLITTTILGDLRFSMLNKSDTLNYLYLKVGLRVTLFSLEIQRR